VLAYFLRRLNREDAVEATADVFMAAWRRAADVPDGEGARLSLFGIARNVLRNWMRADRRLRRLLARAAFTSPRLSVRAGFAGSDCNLEDSLVVRSPP
jgi:DNA-directed RNA polymerase specialized sigma24 family protein